MKLPPALREEPRAKVRLALAVAPLLVVALVYAPTLGYGHFGDTRFLIEHNRSMQRWADLWPNLTHDYFWCSDGFAIPYWRPLTKASWLAERLLFAARPMVHHVVQVAWFIAALAGVRAVALRLGAGAVGAAATVLLAGLHPAAIEPVCLVMARSDVVAAAGVAWSLAAWLSWASTGRRAWGVAHAVALAVALGSKEVAVITAPLLTLWALALERDRGRLRALAVKLAPAWALVALYLVARRAALSDAAPARVGFDALKVYVGGARYLEALLPFRFDSGISNLSRAWAATPAMLARSAAAWGALAALAALAVRRRQPAWLMLLAWIGASLAPVLLVGDIQVPGVAGKMALADRWSLQSVMASAVLCSLLAEQLPDRLRRGAYGLVAAWALAACVISGAQRSYYRSEVAYAELEDEVYQSTPERYRTQEDRCRFLDHRLVDALRQGRNEEAYRLSAPALGPCADDQVVQLDHLWAAVHTGRYAEARRALGTPLRDPRYSPRERGTVLQLGAAAMLHTGAPAEAWRMVQGARALGLQGCALDALAAQATAQLGDAAAAERERARAARCERR
jgi:hypothetical protein